MALPNRVRRLQRSAPARARQAKTARFPAIHTPFAGSTDGGHSSLACVTISLQFVLRSFQVVWSSVANAVQRNSHR